MKMKLQDVKNKLDAISSEFFLKLEEAANEVLNNRLAEALQMVFSAAMAMLITSTAVHVFFPEMGTGWRDIMLKLGGIGAFLLIFIFGFYIVVKAGRAMDFSEEFVPKAMLKGLTEPFDRVDVCPYEVVTVQPGENEEDFSARARAAFQRKNHVIVICFRTPIVIIKAMGDVITAKRGDFPFEDGAPECFSETYEEYAQYAREFLQGFKRHVKACMATSTEFEIDEMLKPTLPERIPSNFRNRQRVMSMLLVILLFTPACLYGQSLSDVLGRRASEVPPRGQSVSYVVDNGRTLTYIADGVRNYVQLFNDNQGGLSRRTKSFQMVISGNEVIAKANAVGQASQNVRIGAYRSSDDVPIESIQPRPGVNVRPGLNMSFDADKTTQAIEEFNKESRSLFGDLWAIVRVALRAFGQFILFLMVLLRMFASQAANEMIGTYLGRVWGGSFIVNALMTLSAFQMFMAWMAGGYLLCEWALYLSSANISTLLWFVLLMAGSLVLVKLSKWFVISPRDVADGNRAYSAGNRGMVIRE